MATVVVLGLLSSALGAIGANRVAASDHLASPLGRTVENFQLKDFGGKPYQLSDFAGNKAVVVVYLGTECPLAKLYAPKLVELADKFAQQNVALIAINSNQQDSLSELAAYSKTHGLNFPLLKDLNNTVADQMGAVRTPEVFVLDADRKIVYHGRIDDQFVVGRQRAEATRQDLVAAVDQLLAGQPISVAATEAPGCFIGRVHQPLADAEVTYTGHIAAILNRSCVECHRAGEIAPFVLTSYEDVVGWAETIAEVVRDNRMPPWHADPQFGTWANDCRLSDREKQLIDDWVAAGAPEGNPADLPKPPAFAAGWRLPRVDREVFMSDTPAEIPAEGTVDYKYYSVDPGFTEDVWLQGAQCKAGNASVVHHIIVFIRPPGGKHEGLGNGIARGFLAATAPGAAPMLFEPGMAKKVPAGSQLIFQMHYTPSGSPQQDRSSIGLMFADPKSVKHEVSTIAVENALLLIPPMMANYPVSAWKTFTRDTELLSLYPHMHVRGKAFRYEATYPDGSKEVLLDVPRYDFNWQQTYVFPQPKLIPKGTRMRCLAHYDNSPENIANPDPKRLVHFGEQTWDEMLIGFMEAMPARANSAPAARTAQAPKSTSGAE
jgi:peroxiredoxin/mono/diheme cytochrome c family protein